MADDITKFNNDSLDAADKEDNDSLGPADEEDNESIMSDNPAADNYEACKAAAQKRAASPNNFDVIEKAILDLKSKIYTEIFQNGTTEKVHDTERLNDYVNVCGNIYRHILDPDREPLDEYNATINTAIKEFLELWRSNVGSSSLEKEMQREVLYLHLICFCYCQNSDCLSMDDVTSDSE